MAKKVKRINLGLLKIEHHIPLEKAQPKLVSLEHAKGPFAATPESGREIHILPFGKKHEPEPAGSSQKAAPIAVQFSEVKKLFSCLTTLYAGLIGLLVFLSVYILTMIFISLPWWTAVVATVLALVGYGYRTYRQNGIMLVEQQFPHLNEKLRTAADTVYVQNPVVEELRQEVIADLKIVDYGTFVRQKRTSYQALAVLALCCTIIVLAQLDVGFDFSLSEKIKGFMPGNGNGPTGGIVSDIIAATTNSEDNEIYGDPSVAVLGKDVLNLNINKVGYELNMQDVRPPAQKEFEDSLFPQDVGADQAEVYDKQILKEHQELVKNYFKNLAEGDE